jgi:hypothetical protein
MFFGGSIRYGLYLKYDVPMLDVTKVLFIEYDIKKIVNSSDYTYSLYVFSSDKNYIVNDEKDAFIMCMQDQKIVELFWNTL